MLGAPAQAAPDAAVPAADSGAAAPPPASTPAPAIAPAAPANAELPAAKPVTAAPAGPALEAAAPSPARQKSGPVMAEPASDAPDNALGATQPKAAAAAWVPVGVPAGVPVPTAPRAAEAPAAAVATQAAPAQQVAVVVSQLVSRPGAHRVVLQLQPDDLGHIQVSIERTAAGATHVALTADRPETLRALQQDHAEIARALDRAGVPPEQRTVTLAAGAPAAATPPATRPEAAHGDAAPPPQGSGQAFGQAAGQGQGQPQERPGRQQFATGHFPAGSPAAPEIPPAGRWLRRGFDITA